jgi:hypothetical protein
MRKEDEKQEDVEWAWVDFIEGDVEPSLGSDLQKLLQISLQSRQLVDRLHWTKEMVKSVDPAHDEFLNKWDEKASLMKIMEACQNKTSPWTTGDSKPWQSESEWVDDGVWVDPLKHKSSF